MYLYKILDKNNNIIYIGKTKNIISRMKQHYQDNKIDDWFKLKGEYIYYAKCKSQVDCDILEIYLISKYKPKYNKEFKNKDKFSISLDHIVPEFAKYHEESISERISYEKLYRLDYMIQKLEFDKIKLFTKESMLYKDSSFLMENTSSKYKEDILSLKKNIYTYFYNNTKTKSKENIWTCCEKYKDSLKGKGYTKGWRDVMSRNKGESISALVFAYESGKGRYFVMQVLLNFIYRYQNKNTIHLYIPSRQLCKEFYKLQKEMI